MNDQPMARACMMEPAGLHARMRHQWLGCPCCPLALDPFRSQAMVCLQFAVRTPTFLGGSGSFGMKTPNGTAISGAVHPAGAWEQRERGTVGMHGQKADKADTLKTCRTQ